MESRARPRSPHTGARGRPPVATRHDARPIDRAAHALLFAAFVLLLLVAFTVTRAVDAEGIGRNSGRSAPSAAPRVAPSPPENAIRVDTLITVDAGTGGISVDRAGNVYTSDFGAILGDPSTAGTKIFEVTPGGEESVFATGLDGASGSGIDSKGNFYQSNIRGGFVTRIPPGGGDPVEFARETIRSPVGIEVGPDDTLYVANCGAASITRITPDGRASQLVQSSLLNCPNGITRAPDGTLYVANFQDGNVIAVSPAGQARVHATLPGSNNGHLVYHLGALYVVARSAHQIYRVDMDGEVSLFAGSGEKGGADGPPEEASFCYPNDLGWSPDGGILYVNDVADHSSEGRILAPTRIRRIWVEQ